jgi:hypothetical protein
VRKTTEAERNGLEALRKTQMRKHGKMGLSKAQRAYNRYVVVVTAISDAAPGLIHELYRQRWQIELVFKRLKPLFGNHEIPVHIERSARAWFYGKLLLAALWETWVNTGPLTCFPYHIRLGEFSLGLCYGYRHDPCIV